MPRLSKKPPKLSRHASGQAFVRVDGANRYLGRWGSAEARAAYAAFKKDWKPAPPVQAASPVQRLTVAELLVRYFEHASRVYPGATLAGFKTPIRTTRELFGEIRCVDFGPLKLEQVREAFLERGLSRSVANRYSRTVVSIFRWGVSRELVSPESLTRLATLPPLRRGQPGLRENPRVLPVPDEIVEKTLPHLPAVVAAMVRLQRLCGARPGEIVQIRPADIDQSGDVWRYIPEKHKNAFRGHDRVILFGPRAIEILRPFLNRRPEQFCFDPREAVAEMREKRRAARQTPLSYGNRAGTNVKRKPAIVAGNRYTACSYCRAVARGAKLAGAPHWSPNQLRHSLATEIRSRFNLETAQVLAGHSLRSTTERYAEKDLTQAVAAMKAIG